MDKKVGKHMWFKGIVMEVKEDYSLVMKEDSQIVRVKNKEGMKKGDINIFLEEDLYEEKTSNKKNKGIIISILSIAAVLAIIVLPMMQSNKINSYALVSLDINPSINFELDDNMNIVSIRGVNKDGKNLNLESLNGLTLDEGLKKLKIDLENKKYNLSKDSIIVGFTFLTDKEDNTYENDVKNIIGTEFKGSKTAFFKGTKKNSEVAEQKGISLGRYEAKLSMDEDIMEEQIENMSVEEILDLLKNKKNIYLNEEQVEELQDELEDRLEDRYDDKYDDKYDYDDDDKYDYDDDDDYDD